MNSAFCGGGGAPDERLPAAQSIAHGVQHVVAMFGAILLYQLWRDNDGESQP